MKNLKTALITCGAVWLIAACTHSQTEPVKAPKTEKIALPSEVSVVDEHTEVAGRNILEREQRQERAELHAQKSQHMVHPSPLAVESVANMSHDATLTRQASVAHFQPHPDYAYAPPRSQEKYAEIETNSVKRVDQHPVSTFSVDVDTGSYANLRRFLQQGQLPPENAVRIEEMINAFDYDYTPPKNRHQQPFSIHTEIAKTPWNKNTQLLHIGLQGWKPQGELPPSNLVFLLDVSGSMHSQDKLPLLKAAMKMLTQELREQDRISIVTYAGNSGLVLNAANGHQKAKIVNAIDGLQAGGSTNGASGITLAYQVAREHFVKDGINRIMLATDGDFNVGVTHFDDLKKMVEQQRKDGVALSTLGFGQGNYNDHLMEQLADAGNGNYSYVDSLTEAHKVLVRNRAATLMTIAKDVKIQVEFNPSVVAEYRLIGYENRALKREDFNNDAIDAGEIGAGHSVTALYEVALVGSKGTLTDDLRYASTKKNIRAELPVFAEKTEMAFVKLRYKKPDGDTSKLVEHAVQKAKNVSDILSSSEALRWSAAVAASGQLIRHSQYSGDFEFDDVITLATAAKGKDEFGDRAEFVRLMALAKSLSTTQLGHNQHSAKPENLTHLMPVPGQ